MGAVFRIAAEGEWRTNIALGGVRRRVVIELDGAVEFTSEYQPGGDVFSDVAGSLARHAYALLASRASASAAA